MLVEFKRLERQLLGAPSHQANPPKPESTASRERREKLHVFIIHIEDTVRQVEEGLALEKQEEEARKAREEAEAERKRVEPQPLLSASALRRKKLRLHV